LELPVINKINNFLKIKFILILAATGDGDILMRFLPSFLAVEFMRNDVDLVPDDAARLSLQRIANFYPNFVGGIVVVDKYGNYGAACHGIKDFPFSIASAKTGSVIVERRRCI
jgi:N4-(beta-N-acetylglucosaminyl)-L-asparaginase